MEETVFFIAGLVLGTAASIGVARMQERHGVRVHILRDFLPLLTFNPYHQDMSVRDRMSELVTFAIPLRKDERDAIAKLAEVVEDRMNTNPSPGIDRDKATDEVRELMDTHVRLQQRRSAAMAELQLLLGKRLRMFGRLSPTEKKALKQ